jgi:hypothetical protein
MNGKTLIVALSILAVAVTAASADPTTTTKKKKPVPPPAAEVTEPAPPPMTHAVVPEQCYTDEGYGRRLPCSMGK